MNTPTMHSRRQGFTLMEVLVSSALTVVILTMLFTVLIGAMNAWQTGTNRLQGNADARMALDSIAQDLQSIVVRQTSIDQEWLYADQVPVANAPEGTRSTWLTFFAPSLDREPNQQGDIVAISYKVGFQDPLSTNTPAFPIFGLYKHMIDTRNTFNLALGLENVRADFWNGNPTLEQNLFAPQSVNPLSPQSLLIPNVVDFNVDWNVHTIGSVQPLSSDANIRLNNSLFAGVNEFPNTPVGGGRIESADISLTILTEEGRRMVQTYGRAGTLPQNLDRVIREHGRVYTKRVKIQY